MSLYRLDCLLIVGFLVIIACLCIDADNTDCSGPSESYLKCGPNCETVCATLDEPCLINYIVCPSGCYCDNGYARDADNICIPIEKCDR